VAEVVEIDARRIKGGPVTGRIKEGYQRLMEGGDEGLVVRLE
jgi:hypothetical protein